MGSLGRTIGYMQKSGELAVCRRWGMKDRWDIHYRWSAGSGVSSCRAEGCRPAHWLLGFSFLVWFTINVNS